MLMGKPPTSSGDENDAQNLEQYQSYWEQRSKGRGVRKLLSGIRGLDEVLEGGIPYGRPLLISGSTGTGKTVMLNEFLYRGITQFNQNGVFVTLEENPEDIIINVEGFGWDYRSLLEQNKLAFVNLVPKDFVEISPKYNFSPIIERIKYAITKVDAKRVAIDNLGTIFHRFSNKSEIRYLMLQISNELKKLGVTSMISVEKDDQTNLYPIAGVQEYVADGLIDLSVELGQQRLLRKLCVRKLRGVGYRSGIVGFDIKHNGIQVYPKIPLDPAYAKTDFKVRVAFGLESLDQALGGGIPQGHIMLIGGNTGTGKTILGLHFLVNGLQNNESTVLVALEEPTTQVYKTALNLGWDLSSYEQRKKLITINPNLIDIEPDLLLHQIMDTVRSIQAKRLVIDSISSLESGTMNVNQLREFLIQMVLFLKSLGVTTIFTYLTKKAFGADQGQLLAEIATSDVRLSSIVDGIILLRFVERNQQVRKLLTILKLRGSPHQKDLFMYEIDQDGFNLGGKFKA
ncbi:MAG: hypothetical protein EU536_01720 [Promethearchaeota archaeon]|nr:MAG: hypothetical protein EU536_01720 [Candidatus Lokiarchaeota archaeon]